MWFGIIINLCVSIIILVSGYFIGKGKISLIHDYHYKHVEEKDYKAYTRLYSIGMYTIGVGILISNIFFYIDSNIGIGLSYLGSFVIGFLFFWKAQNRYNQGKWFT